MSDGNSFSAGLSADGRYVAFQSDATNLVPDDDNGVTDVFVKDRLTGLIKRVSLPAGSGEGNAPSVGSPSPITDDGREVFFTSSATNLVASDTNTVSDVFVRTLSPSALAAADRTGDGDGDDTVLEVLDTANSARSPLCPAGQASVAGGKVAFLRPEASGETTVAKLPLCPLGTPVTGGVDLNGDNDSSDLIVHLWTGSGDVLNLGQAATAVAMSDTTIAAIYGTVRVHPVGTGSWTDTGVAATTIAVVGDVVVMLTPGSELRLYDTSTGTLVSTGQTAEDFVAGPRLIAFRTREATAATNLNAAAGDTDTADDVLQTWTLSPVCLSAAPPPACLGASGQAVTPCRLEACDPRIPYRVAGDSVKFLTFECDQGGGGVAIGCTSPGGGTDINGDGDAGDLVIQIYDTVTRTVTVVGTAVRSGRGESIAGGCRRCRCQRVGHGLRRKGAMHRNSRDPPDLLGKRRLQSSGLLRSGRVQEGAGRMHRGDRLFARCALRHDWQQRHRTRQPRQRRRRRA